MPSTSTPTPRPDTDSPLAASRQLLVVKAPAWESGRAELQRFARPSLAADWQAVGERIPVSLGKSGLGWGRGCHRAVGAAGPVKREGDGRAPAGIFAITELFGYAGQDSPFARAARLPYRCATRDLKCIDDPLSRHYNRLVDLGEPIDRDWVSHEEMLRDDERYAVGAVIAHNSRRPVAGAGSCIFLHVWQSAGLPTAGCTAASLADISEICRWLDGDASPLLVQLPQSEYRRFRARWALP